MIESTSGFSKTSLAFFFLDLDWEISLNYHKLYCHVSFATSFRHPALTWISPVEKSQPRDSLKFGAGKVVRWSCSLWEWLCWSWAFGCMWLTLQQKLEPWKECWCFLCSFVCVCVLNNFDSIPKNVFFHCIGVFEEVAFVCVARKKELAGKICAGLEKKIRFQELYVSNWGCLQDDLLTSFCSRWFFAFCHGKSPLNDHLGKYFCCFPTTFTANLS